MLSLRLRNLSQNLFSVKFKLVCILRQPNQTLWNFVNSLLEIGRRNNEKNWKISKNENVIAAYRLPPAQWQKMKMLSLRTGHRRHNNKKWKFYRYVQAATGAITKNENVIAVYRPPPAPRVPLPPPPPPRNPCDPNPCGPGSMCIPQAVTQIFNK